MKKPLHYRMMPLSSLIDDKIIASRFRHKELRYSLCDYYAASSSDIVKTMFSALLVDEILIKNMDMNPNTIKEILEKELLNVVNEENYEIDRFEAIKEFGVDGYLMSITEFLYKKGLIEIVLKHLESIILDTEKVKLENHEIYGGELPTCK